MGNLLFWLGIGAAQKGAGSKPIERPRWVASLVVSILIELLTGAGAFVRPSSPHGEMFYSIAISKP